MKISRISSVAMLAGGASAQVGAWGQCGGENWTGGTTCISEYTCVEQNQWYSQCLVGTATTTASTTLTTRSTSSKAATSSKSTQSTTLTISTTSAKTTSSATTSTTTTKASSTTTTSSASVSGTVKLAGVNIAGFDFGVSTDGSDTVTSVTPPITSLGGPDGAGQMSHFVKDDGMNVFRLPVGWQYLVGSTLGGTLSSTAIADYDLLVQACLATGAYCIIDIHNYARWNGAIIGQGGPTNAQFTSLWEQLAAKYATESNVIFGIMNEPHDLSSVTTWATTVQAAVTAIRGAGATSQMILLPGNDWTHASSLISDGSAAALATVTNTDGTTDKLIFDVHQYLDSDNSGTNAECVTNNIASAFEPLATWLRTNRRLAFLSETGGGNVASCVTYMCQQIAYLNENSDVFLGYTGWAAGSFSATTYTLTETPTLSGTTWTDQTLVESCLAR